jgi:hypothetical protein
MMYGCTDSTPIPHFQRSYRCGRARNYACNGSRTLYPYIRTPGQGVSDA